MTFIQIVNDGLAVLGAVGAICTVLQHRPLPAVWVERFARAATWASNAAVSVNSRKGNP